MVLVLAHCCAGASAWAQSTRPERTAGRETSTYADVLAFVDTVSRRSSFQVGWLGTTTEGRRIPWVLAARGVRTPAEAERKGRLVVWLQGNIHAGEVEGKEAAQMILRSLGTGELRPLLDSLVVIVVPIYNADGNEAFGPSETNRPGQNGPARVGRGTTTLGLNLNRDYVKQEAPETRAATALINIWRPHLFIDLHTTNGSYHGYALTWAPGLNPNELPANAHIRDGFLPTIRTRMQAGGFETFPYGNFRNQHPDSLALGWETYDARPRFGTNWMGLRGRMAILSEGYSNDPFPRRIEATERFVREILVLAAEQKGQLLALSRDGERARPGQVAVRSGFAAPTVQPVIAEVTESDDDGDGPFARRRRTGRFVTVEMPVYDRFTAARSETRPAGYYIPPSLPDVADLMIRQGVTVTRVPEQTRVVAEVFRVDSLRAMPYAFEGHRMVTVEGAWQPADSLDVPAGSWFVDTDQPYGTLAVYLLEPASEDGVVAWNFVDRLLGRGRGYPIVRVQ
jgi:hypothetical protein